MSQHLILNPFQSQGHMNTTLRYLWCFCCSYLGVYFSLLSILTAPKCIYFQFTNERKMRSEGPRESQGDGMEPEKRTRRWGKLWNQHFVLIQPAIYWEVTMPGPMFNTEAREKSMMVPAIEGFTAQSRSSLKQPVLKQSLNKGLMEHRGSSNRHCLGDWKASWGRKHGTWLWWERQELSRQRLWGGNSSEHGRYT